MSTWCEDCCKFGDGCRCGVSASIPDDPDPIGFAPSWRLGSRPEIRDRKTLEREVRAYRKGSASAEEALALFADPYDGLDALAAIYGQRPGYGRRAAAAESFRLFGGVERVASHVESVASEERKAKRQGRLLARVLDVHASDLGRAVREAADSLAPWIVVPIGHPSGRACGIDRRVASELEQDLRQKARNVVWRLDLTPARESVHVSYTGRQGQRGRVRLAILPIDAKAIREAKAAPPEIPNAWIYP